MEYRRLGRSGIKVSQFSYGSWVTFSNQMDAKPVIETMAAARDYGVNFFDNAEAYAQGQSEEIMGIALKELRWPRSSYLISTKFFWGLSKAVNASHTLNRKYLLEAITASLKRLCLEHVDLVYCHRPDPETPIEETVWAMHTMIDRGYAHYWGTSEWSADEIRAAWLIAERHHLHKPVVEQPQYNLCHRKRVENEYARLYQDIGIGLTTWSPLASGILTGKYLNGIPEGTRAAMPGLGFVTSAANDEKLKTSVRHFVNFAKALGTEPAPLAIAWCTKNPHVSSVITGSSKISQLKENMKALELINKLTSTEMKQLSEIFPDEQIA